MTEINATNSTLSASKPRRKGSVGWLLAAATLLVTLTFAFSEMLTVRNALAYPLAAVLLFLIYKNAMWMIEEVRPIIDRFSLSPTQRLCTVVVLGAALVGTLTVGSLWHISQRIMSGEEAALATSITLEHSHIVATECSKPALSKVTCTVTFTPELELSDVSVTIAAPEDGYPLQLRYEKYDRGPLLVAIGANAAFLNAKHDPEDIHSKVALAGLNERINAAADAAIEVRGPAYNDAVRKYTNKRSYRHLETLRQGDTLYR